MFKSLVDLPKVFVWVGLLLVLSLSSAAVAIGPVPRFEETACKFQRPRSGTRCGDLIVREDRSNPDSPAIRIHVGIVPPLDPTNAQPDPVVYLDGGPGGWSLYWVGFRSELTDMYRNRELIVFDQRGIGFSEPALDCPELIDFYYEYLPVDLPVDEAEWLSEQRLAQCRDRLVANGINLAAYTSAASAADLEDLRTTLGYDQWNLYGISYGTRLALTAMRDFPEGIRSVVIDSVLPLQADNLMEVPTLAENVFRELFDACAADERCSTNFPELENHFYDLANRLDDDPVTVNVRHPITGVTHQMLINGYAIRNSLFTSLYSTSTIPTLPRMIYDAYDGNYADIAEEIFYNIVGFEFFSIGMYYSVNCSDEIMFRSADDYRAADEAYPHQEDSFDSQFYVKNCNLWDVPRAGEVEMQPVESDIPTLLIAGQFDPITPASYAFDAAETLYNSYVFVFPGTGHGTTFDNGCAARIAAAFVDNPTRRPNNDCMAQLSGVRFMGR